MTEQSGRGLQTELNTSQEKHHSLETGQRPSIGTPARRRLRGFSRKLLLGALPVALLLAAGGHLYGQDAINALFIDKDGNVGVATSPAAKLDVAGTVRLGKGIADSWFPSTDKNAYISGKETIFRSDSGGSYKEFARINKDGNVGVATSPEAKLDVAGTVRLGKGIAESWFPYTDNNAYISGKETIVRSDSGGGSAEFARINKDGATFGGKVGIGKASAGEKLEVSGGKIQLDGNQQIKFKDGDITNNLKLQLWTGYGLGINGSTLFYAANGMHSWRDNNGANERMVLTTGADGGLTVKGTGNSSFAGALYVRGPLNYYWGPDKAWKKIENRANDFAGSYTTGGPSPSDLRFKTDLKTIPSALDKIRSLRAVTYRWNETALQYFTRDIETTFSAGPNATEEENQKVWQTERSKEYKELANSQVGVVAQDVEAVLPEAVSTDEAGYKSVRYQYLIPLLIAALKEQDETVKDQTQIISRQQQEIARLAAANLAVQQQLTDLADVKAQVARLEAALGNVDAGRSFVVPNAAISLTRAQPR